MKRLADLRWLAPVAVLATVAVLSSSAFAATAPKPSITSFTPSAAKASTTVTVIGAHFTGVKTVKIGSKTVTFKVLSPKKLSLTLPKSVKTGKIAVTTSGGTAMSAKTLTIKA